MTTYAPSLWTQTVGAYLQKSLWQADPYAAGHMLAVPMGAAFANGTTKEIAAFADHFNRFMALDKESLATCHESKELARIIYLYLAARFCRVTGDLSGPLANRLRGEYAGWYTTKTAWHYAPRHMPGGRRAVLILKSSGKVVPRDYYRAVNDLELVALAGMTELGMPDAYSLLLRIIVERGVFGHSGWLFQPGIWWDHPDHAYAGHVIQADKLVPLPLCGCSEDVFHSHRWGLVLRTMADNCKSKADGAFIGRVQAGLSSQLMNRVLLLPSPEFVGPRVTNYMDGHNGIYRYARSSNKPQGYPPYGQSGSLPMTWWAYLPGMQTFWEQFAALFPLQKDVQSFYETATSAAYYQSGFAEMNVRAASGAL